MEIKQILEQNFTKITNQYQAFALEKDKCRACSLYEHYKQVVQSEGNAEDPTFMFVGEAPGKDEVEQIRPFIGMAGQRLRAELRKHKKTFRRDNVLISNVLACRPKDNKFPGVFSLEVKTCAKQWLVNEIKMVKPKILITLGNPATRYLRGDSSISLSRGKWKFLPLYRCWSMATYHPSYVIRNERSNKKYIVDQFEQDIQQVACMWSTFISDYRLSMSEDEWKRTRALQFIQDSGLAGK